MFKKQSSKRTIIQDISPKPCLISNFGGIFIDPCRPCQQKYGDFLVNLKPVLPLNNDIRAIRRDDQILSSTSCYT